eukprot:363719-Chlamydomonas_euryale.AAC.3
MGKTGKTGKTSRIGAALVGWAKRAKLAKRKKRAELGRPWCQGDGVRGIWHRAWVGGGVRRRLAAELQQCGKWSVEVSAGAEWEVECGSTRWCRVGSGCESTHWCRVGSGVWKYALVQSKERKWGVGVEVRAGAEWEVECGSTRWCRVRSKVWKYANWCRVGSRCGSTRWCRVGSGVWKYVLELSAARSPRVRNWKTAPCHHVGVRSRCEFGPTHAHQRVCQRGARSALSRRVHTAGLRTTTCEAQHVG